MMLVFAILRVVAILALTPAAYDWRSPQLFGVRGTMLLVLLTVPLLIAALEIWLVKSGRTRGRMLRGLSLAALAACGFVWLSTAFLETRFYWQRSQVLAAAPAQIETLGRHFVVGFRNWEDLDLLIEHRAIAGIYVSAHNVRDLSSAGINRKVDALQARRREQGLPPLWITTDQEGGGVSRLSPPLIFRLTLAELIEKITEPGKRDEAVQIYGTEQGRELAAAGVNLNFAPVVDLNFRVMNPKDRSTQIYKRAISNKPETVRDIARIYCAALLTSGVRCTLKHFPGLGRVSGDTHLEAASLNAPVTELENSDWVPFRALAANSVTMLGHAQLKAVDASTPASFSKPVIGILRQWAPNGVLITDDFSMGAVYWSADGITGASIGALNAGIDLILISYDFDQFYPVMHALLNAERNGTLNTAALRDSEARLALTKPTDR